MVAPVNYSVFLGLRFDRLVVESVIAPTTVSKRTYLLCACNCGKQKEVVASHVIAGSIRSCGCLVKEGTQKKHGYANKPEYPVWQMMIQRCHNKNSGGYYKYGARGIKVCVRWHKFENFIADMGPRPSSDYSVERIDNNKGYCKKNCRWATRHEQAQNTRRNRRVTFNGETKTLAEWSRDPRCSVSAQTLRTRFCCSGWSFEKALVTPNLR